MSVKLTTYIREQIVKDLMKHRFTKACDKLTKDGAAFAVKVYKDLYPRAMMAKIEALPTGWLVTDDDIKAQFSGRVDSLAFNGALYGVVGSLCTSTPAVFKPFLAKDRQRVVAVYDADHPLAVAHADLKARQKELGEQISLAQKQAEAAVDSATTLKRLVELWPEVEPFARRHEKDKAPLPALPTKDLNALLDLPVS